MPRLLAFGCSFVYGHGLPDCYTEDKRFGPSPSKFAWPQLLADRLGYECHNMAQPGIGNFEILFKIIKTEFQPDDIVITAWTFFPRYDFYKIVDFEGNGASAWQKYKLKNTDPMTVIVGENLKNNEHYIATNYWDNWLAIHHAELFLNNKNIKNFGYHGLRPQRQSSKPSLLGLNNFLDISLILEDRAQDEMHPGMESHRLQAELIYSTIIERIK